MHECLTIFGLFFDTQEFIFSAGDGFDARFAQLVARRPLDGYKRKTIYEYKIGSYTAKKINKMTDQQLIAKIKSLEDEDKTLVILLEISTKDDGFLLSDIARDLGQTYSVRVNIASADSKVKKW